MTPQLVASVAISLLFLACVADPQLPATDEPGPADTLAATATPQATGRVTLNAVGDLMLARDIVTLMDEHGWGYPFAAVRELLADADITIANLEGTFTERGEAASKLYTFRTPPRHAPGIAEAGIDVVSLGNNHTLDFGAAGLGDTLTALDAAGGRYGGAAARPAAGRPAAVDAGAALVLGHHAHVLQGWERIGGALIVYGLGNFVFDLDRDDLATLGPRPFQTVVLRVDLTREGVQGVTARPVFIDPDEDRPRPATGDEAREIQALNSALR